MMYKNMKEYKASTFSTPYFCNEGHTHTVQGKNYLVLADYNRRCSVAQAPDGRVAIISAGGYITKDLTVRKAIAAAFGLDSFRK